MKLFEDLGQSSYREQRSVIAGRMDEDLTMVL